MVVGLLLFASSASAFGPQNLDAGLQHTCFVTPTGTVKCWGDNEHGQLGDGTTTERHTPVEVTGISGVIEVTAGASFDCALTGEGKVWCWGDNEHGQLGDGTATDRHSPVEVTGLPLAVEIEAGGDHACAIAEAPGTWCWGDNEHGQLGDGTTTERHSPVEVPGLSGAGGIAAGTAHTCARLEARVECWGDNEHGQLGDGTTTERHSPVIAISGFGGTITAGSEHTCANIGIRTSVWCWGDNEHGQLGDGTTTDRHSPVEVIELPGSGALVAGGSYTCTVSYFAWCWGDNEHGQLNDGTTTDRHTPVELDNHPINGLIAAGGSHACTLNEPGKIRCWGDNEHGQLGNGSTSVSSAPVGVKTLAGATAVATGGSTSCAITGDAKVKCWGEQDDVSSPTEIAGLANVTGIGVGGNHSCALATQVGKVWCWGGNEDGQLGDGTTTDRDEPVEASGLANATSITLGGLHTCAVIEAGTVECWGDNEHGQLGDSTTTERHTPVEVTGVSGMTEVTAGASFNCALTGEGKVWCWGDNEHGQLGDGTTTDRHSPVEVTGLPPAVEVAAGGDHACAISEALEVWCWGDNEHGQLGDGTTTDRHSPVEVTGLSGAAQITSGADHTCVIETAAYGLFWCWGSNEHGQLGDGTKTERHAPAMVRFLAESSMLAAGGAHTCAVLRSGLVECWGANEHGQLGDGANTQQSSPVDAPVEQQGQRVFVQTIGNLTLGEPDFRLEARSSSNLDVTYTSLTQDVCTTVSREVHLVGLGECKVASEQAGNLRYAAAIPVERRFQVGLTPGTGAISGRVTKEGGEHDPLPQILVCALEDEEEEEGQGQNCALTDAEGGYIIANLPVGVYHVEFWPRYSGAGYVFEYYKNALSWSHAKPVEVTEALAKGVNAELTDGGEISGKVTAASDGEPLGDVLVCAEDVNQEFEECEYTSEDGTYRIQGLVKGKYAVLFLVPEGEGFRSQAYKGKPISSEGDPVQVATGGVVGNVNAALEPEAIITGLVSDASNSGGLGEIEVCAFELTGFKFEVCELSEPAGTYTLSDLPAGKYKIGFFPESLSEEEAEAESSPFPIQYWNDKPSWESADILTLGLGTAGGIDARLGASSTPPMVQPVTPRPVVAIPPQSVARKHCPAGKKRKKIDGKKRCVRSRKRGHHKHRHRGHARARPRSRTAAPLRMHARNQSRNGTRSRHWRRGRHP